MTNTSSPTRTLGLIGTGAIGGLVLEALAAKRIPYDRAVVLVRSRRQDTEERVSLAGGSIVADVSQLISARPAVTVLRGTMTL